MSRKHLFDDDSDGLGVVLVSAVGSCDSRCLQVKTCLERRVRGVVEVLLEVGVPKERGFTRRR